MVRAEDSGQSATRLATTAAVTVTVLDVNDNPPKILLEEGQQINIPDNLRKGELNYTLHNLKCTGIPTVFIRNINFQYLLFKLLLF
jgi:hypothetical protein